MELATQAALGINTYATNLRSNFESMRVLWRVDSISMSSMVGSLLSRSPMSMIYSTRVTCVAKTTKSLLDAIVKEFNMSQKQDDFVFLWQTRSCDTRPTVADARALNAISLKAQRSSETTFEVSTWSNQCFLGSAGDVWRRLLRRH